MTNSTKSPDLHSNSQYSEQLERLIKLSQEPSFTLPQGLTREQRREWAAGNAKASDLKHPRD